MRSKCLITGECAAVEDEGDLVVPRAVWSDPVHDQESEQDDVMIQLLSQLAPNRSSGGSFASAMPPGRSQPGL